MNAFMFTKFYFLSKKSTFLLLGMLAFICLPFSVAAQKATVSGSVTATDGSPLVGATVLEQGTANGTQTNGNGNFTISVGNNAVLMVSSVGYQDTTVSVNGQSEITIRLKPSVNTLEQVVVVGYGTQRKIDVTGSVANIKGEVISKQSSYNPLSALQGQVAGVQVANSGAPGAPPKLTIRGVGTVYGNTDPLYVVDGVWYNDVSFLNSSDIESVSVLKDASSESIYGIRAANGVVLITTKKGRRNGKSVINYNGFAGNQVVTNQVKMATGPEYAQMINEVYALNGSPALYADPASYGTTDWYHLILRNAFVTNNQISVNGGGEKSTYNFSLGYYHQDGLVKKNDFDKYSMHVSHDYQVTDFLKVGVNTTGILSNSNDAPGGIFYSLFNAAPIVPAFYADGSYGDPADYNIASANQKNPRENIDYFNNTTKTWKLNGNVYADVKFLKSFTFHSSIGGDFEQSEGKGYTPFTNYNYIPVALRTTHSVLSVGRSETRNWILENTLNFDKRIGDHSVKVLLGQGAQQYKSYFLNGSVQDVPQGTSTEYITLGNPSTARLTDGGSLDRVSSYFGRVNYSYQDKYLFTGSLRADGSSKFSSTWGYFPSVGVGWVISKEKFFENQHLFNNLKLRGSWGRVGNLSVPANLSILTAAQTPSLVYVGGNGSSAPGASINSVVPPATTWEVGEGTDVGLDAALVNNKLNVELDWYNKKTINAIFAIPVLGSVGTSSGTIIGNQATFQNQGFEFLVTWKDNINKDWNYSISANGGYNQNKVLTVSSGGNPIYDFLGANVITRTMVGQPIGQFFGRQVVGIFQSSADITGYTNKNGVVIQPTAKPGDFKYKDVNGDGVIDDKDRVPLGNPNPKFIYGFNTTLSYKRFDLTLDFQGVSGVSIYNGNFALRFGGENYTQDFYDNRWHGEGTSNVYPSVNVAGNNSITNSFFVEDGSYFRVRNAQLGYTIIGNKQHSLFSNLRVYINAQNPFTWFSYRGFTPEVQAGSPTLAGIDQQVYPLYATYNFGVNLTF
jgi:TonB-linked SusC/RagA family outer membrane protein